MSGPTSTLAPSGTGFPERGGELRGGLREHHKATRRTRILDAARELLRESPERALSTERIAARAEVAPATVYNLIGPRDKVWEALAAWFMDELQRRLAARSTSDALERTRQVVGLTVGLFVDDPIVSRRMLREWEESGRMLDSPLAHLRQAMVDAQTQGFLLDDVDVTALAAVVASSCVGAMHQWAAGAVDDKRFRARALLALDVTLAAAAADPHRERLLSPLRGRGAPRPRKRRAA